MGAPPSLVGHLPLCGSIAEQAVPWPASLVVLAGGVAMAVFSPDNAFTHGVTYVLLVWGLTWLAERFVLSGRTCVRADGLHLRDRYGRRSVVAWEDVLQVRPARTSLGRTWVLVGGQQGRQRRRVLWGLVGEPARRLADAVGEQPPRPR